MRSATVADYETKLGGVPIHVAEARFERCGACGESSVSATELKRWREAQRRQLREAGQIPSPGDVRRAREHLGLSVADFALLLAVTRQTVHAWERADLEALQLGPASLLLGLLVEEADGTDRGVSDYLRARGRERGMRLD